MRVRLTQRVRQSERRAGELFGQRTGILERTRGDGDLGSTPRDEGLDDLTANVASAEYEHPGFG
jgi:hypothetical protein